jgi:catechol 2,3-dioxygenase-like lactoylglutathione lyase family enzyme
LAAAKAWYARVLGIEPYFDQPFYVGFSVGGFELGLLPKDDAGTSGVSAHWRVADAVSEFTRLIELGAKSHEPVRDVGEGIQVGSVLDPYGNKLAIIENPCFGAKSL